MLIYTGIVKGCNMNNLMIAIILTCLSAGAATKQNDYTTMVCLDDSTGRTITIHAPDTTVTLKDVIYVEHNSSGYGVILKDGTHILYPKPPYKRVYVSLSVDTVKTPVILETSKDTSQVQRNRRKDK